MAFLSGRSNHILLFNYAVDPEVLTPYLPPHTELDFFRGNCFVSMVGVQLTDLKMYGIPYPIFRKYAQVNLRFYVRRRLANGNYRHGVVFLRQIIPHRLIAWGARRIFNEKAVCHRVDCYMGEEEQQSTVVEYDWYVRQQRHFIKAAFREEPYFTVVTAERNFFVERHWGYCAQQDGGCLEYRFDHPAWPAYRALDTSAAVEVGDFYGPPFTAVLGGRPDSVYACLGSSILLTRGLRLHSGARTSLAALPKNAGVAPSPLRQKPGTATCSRRGSSIPTDHRNFPQS